MFKSSENLRLAAEMRALERVAAPWREARTTWFDGTPESIEMRLAATDRVLAHARSGFTTAHLALTREAGQARAELVEAKHRLLNDFLDDGARAFKGSRRVAGDGPGGIGDPTVDDIFEQQDAYRRYPEEQRARANAGFLEEMDPEDRPGYGEGDTAECQHCGERIEDYGNGWEHPDGYLPIYGDHEAVPYDEDDEEGSRPPFESARKAGRTAGHDDYDTCESCGKLTPVDELENVRDLAVLCPECAEKAAGESCDYCGGRTGDHLYGCTSPDRYAAKLHTARMISDHEFKPYSDNPEYCVGELPRSGNTCNKHYTQHAHVDPEDRKFLDGDDDDEDVCAECGAPLDDGEGYDGYCGSCADKLEETHHWGSRRTAGGKMPDGSDMPDEAESARYVLDFMRRKGIDQLNVDDENRYPSYQRDFDDEDELDDAVAWVPRELIYNRTKRDDGPSPWNPVIRRQDIEDWFARNPKHRKVPRENYEMPPEADPGTNRNLLSRREERDRPFESARLAAGPDGLDDLTQRKALNLVKGWMSRYLGHDEDDVPSGDRAYESGAGLKLHPAYEPTWQDPITGAWNKNEPVPAILHEGYSGWADDASFDDDLREQLKNIGVEPGNWNGSVLTLHPYEEWEIPEHVRRKD